MNPALFSRRHWGRELTNLLRWPFSMLEEKGDRARRISQFRVILIVFMIQFARHWPTTWGKWEWLALTTIALAIAVRDLAALVPFKEMMTALAATFSGKAAAKLRDVVTPAPVVVVTPAAPATAIVVTPAVVPEPEPAEFEPHEWAQGDDPDDGLL